MSLPRTPSQTVGPFFAIGLCRRPDSELDPEGVVLAGRLLDGRDEPIDDGVVELWEPVSGRWGRCGTDGEGRFSFRIPAGGGHLEAAVFARGLLRHQLTRVYLRDDADDQLLSTLDPRERATLIARHEQDGLRFDIRMQGEHATVFFAH